ncbi:MAG: hypothetical protein ACO1HP_07515 [Bacteroidota bacterium]
MSTVGTLMQVCPDIQAELDQYFLTCGAEYLREPAPLFEALMLDPSRANIQNLLAAGGNKVRTGQLIYSPRIGEASVVASGSKEMSCSSDTKRGNIYHSYEIDTTTGYEISELMNTNDWQQVCQGNSQIFAKKVQQMMDALIRKMATVVTNQAVALRGPWDTSVTNVDGSNFLDIDTKLSGGNPNPEAWEQIDLALMQSNFCAAPMIFSGPTLYSYARLMQAGCCATSGLDLGQMAALYGKAVAYDKRVATAFSSAHKALVVQPGSMHIVTYTANDDGLTGPQYGGSYLKTVVTDPATGFPIDLKIVDNCGEGISVIMRGLAKVVALPDDMFRTGDTMEGVNYVTGIVVTNP